MIKLTTDEFIKKCKIFFGDKYDFSKTVYKHSKEKLIVICPIHGKFEQMPYSMMRGVGCLQCSGNYLSNTKEFINKATKIHKNRYEYNLVEYKNSKEYIKIVCKNHGIFFQTPSNHLKGMGCSLCNDEAKKLTTIEFITRSNEAHNNKYDYSKSVYTKAKNKIEIVCPKHGSYFQVAHYHLCGNGCPKCNLSAGEKTIANWLKKHGVLYVSQKSFKDCRGQRYPLRFDFYLIDHNICIEYDGEHHYRPVLYGNSPIETAIRNFESVKRNDEIKNRYCIENSITLLRIRSKDTISHFLNEELKPLI